MSKRGDRKRRRKVEKKRKAGLRATRMMYRFKQISKEDRDELVDFWITADAETVLRVVNKGRSDAADQLEAAGVSRPRVIAKLRRGDRE